MAMHAAGTGSDSFTWTPALPAAGRFRVYARWSAHANRASDAPYRVHHAGGATTVRVNQELNGGQWMPLGAFDLDPAAGHKVVLSDDANEYVVADAVKFLRETNSRAVVADALKLVATTPAADFSATASSLLREYITVGGQPLALIEGGQVLTVHPDHLGSPQKMTDPGGALVWDALYKPFGEAHAITGTAANAQRFPGQRYDAETSFHYNYFRDYDPSLGRYVQSDPIGLRGGLNTYAYVSGDPIGWIDPDGLAKKYPNTKSRKCKREEWDVCKIRCGRRGVLSCGVQTTRKLKRVIRKGIPIEVWHTDKIINCECGDREAGELSCDASCKLTILIGLLIYCLSGDDEPAFP